MIPRSLGIAAPSGEDVWEVYLEVESRPSILGKVSDILGKRNIDILGAHVQVSDDKKVGYIVLYVEMKGSTATMDDVVGEMERRDFVLRVKAESRRRVFLESQMFPLTSGGHYRGFFTGASSWVALAKSIFDRFGSGGEVLLQSQGASVGGDVVKKIREKLGEDVDRETLIDNVSAVFRADGLGVLELSTEGEDGRAVKVSVGDSAASASGEKFVDHFLVGFVKGAIESVFSSTYVVEGLRSPDGKIEFTLTRAG